MKKRFLAILLAAVMCAGLFIAPASAATATLTEIVSAETLEGILRELHVPAWQGILKFNDGIAWIRNTTYSADACAIDTTGKVVIKTTGHRWVDDFSDGVAWVQRDKMFYVIDTNGHELFNVAYEDSFLQAESQFQEGFCKVFSGSRGGYGYLDKTGKAVIPFGNGSQQSGPFCEGLAVCYDSATAYYGYMDKTGKAVIPYQYNFAQDFTNGIAAVQLGNRWTVIDKTGKDLLPQGYSLDSINSPSISPQVVGAQGPDYSKVFINRAGQVVSGGYYSIFGFTDGMAKVAKNNNEHGFVNEAGVLVIPCDYRIAYDFRDGFTAARREYDSASPHDILDKTGKVVGTTNGVRFASNAGNGCFKIQLDEGSSRRYGFVDYTGKEIVPCKYYEVRDFSGGVAVVETFDRKLGFVDTSGAEIIPCKYRNVVYSNEPGIFAVQDDSGKWSILKSSGWTKPSVPTTPDKPANPGQTFTAIPTNDQLTVDGKVVAPTTYKIGGDNYVKLRDVAKLIDGKSKQFNVDWDAASNSANIITGQKYVPNNTELSGAPTSNETATISNDKILINGKTSSLVVYKIGSANYVQLRKLGMELNFNVGYKAGVGAYIDGNSDYDPAD